MWGVAGSIYISHEVTLKDGENIHVTDNGHNQNGYGRMHDNPRSINGSKNKYTRIQLIGLGRHHALVTPSRNHGVDTGEPPYANNIINEGNTKVTPLLHYLA